MALAVLGIQLTHSKPGQPAGRGKIERLFRTVREQFLVELQVPGALTAVTDLAALNELFAAWVETVYHQREHTETEQKPLERFLAAGPPPLPTPELLRGAFLWSHTRQVTKTATLSLHGNRYEVDAALIGRKVEVVFDPFDLTSLEVRYQGRPMGHAIPHRIGRHVHPDARPDLPPPPPAPTGIDYLGLVAAQHRAQLAARINYHDLPTAAALDSTARRAQDQDAALESELASFSALHTQLGRQPAAGELPGQLDLTDHLSDDDDSEGP